MYLDTVRASAGHLNFLPAVAEATGCIIYPGPQPMAAAVIWRLCDLLWHVLLMSTFLGAPGDSAGGHRLRTHVPGGVTLGERAVVYGCCRWKPYATVTGSQAELSVQANPFTWLPLKSLGSSTHPWKD